MGGRVYRFLTADHERLDALLGAAAADSSRINPEPYELFRAGLLRHIAMEEKVLMPDIRRLLGPLPEVDQIRSDHAALAALLIPSPTHPIITTIRRVLDEHNPMEERPGGLYDAWERAAGEHVDECLARMLALPEVKVAPHANGPRVQESVANLLRARVRG
jgi:hypothetical protein